MRKSWVLLLFLAAALLFSCSEALAASSQYKAVVTLERVNLGDGAHPMNGNWRIASANGEIRSGGSTNYGTYVPGSSNPATFSVNMSESGGKWKFNPNAGVDVEFKLDITGGGEETVRLGNISDMSELDPGKKWEVYHADRGSINTVEYDSVADRITVTMAGTGDPTPGGGGRITNAKVVFTLEMLPGTGGSHPINGTWKITHVDASARENGRQITGRYGGSSNPAQFTIETQENGGKFKFIVNGNSDVTIALEITSDPQRMDSVRLGNSPDCTKEATGEKYVGRYTDRDTGVGVTETYELLPNGNLRITMEHDRTPSNDDDGGGGCSTVGFGALGLALAAGLVIKRRK